MFSLFLNDSVVLFLTWYTQKTLSAVSLACRKKQNRAMFLHTCNITKIYFFPYCKFCKFMFTVKWIFLFYFVFMLIRSPATSRCISLNKRCHSDNIVSGKSYLQSLTTLHKFKVKSNIACFQVWLKSNTISNKCKSFKNDGTWKSAISMNFLTCKLIILLHWSILWRKYIILETLNLHKIIFQMKPNPFILFYLFHTLSALISPFRTFHFPTETVL